NQDPGFLADNATARRDEETIKLGNEERGACARRGPEVRQPMKNRWPGRGVGLDVTRSTAEIEAMALVIEEYVVGIRTACRCCPQLPGSRIEEGKRRWLAESDRDEHARPIDRHGEVGPAFAERPGRGHSALLQIDNRDATCIREVDEGAPTFGIKL